MNLNKRLARIGVKVILSDLDDTLLHTNRLFLKYITAYCADICRVTNIDVADLKPRVEQLNAEFYRQYAVSPLNWRRISDALIAHYGDKYAEAINKAYVHMIKIYKTVPDLREGVAEFLEDIARANVRFGIVTHATEEWTALKVDTHNLALYFEKLKVVDAEVHKDEARWTEAIQNFDVDPSEVIIIGDSLISDMWPGYKAGVRKLIWMDKDDGWSEYRRGEPPPGMVTVTQMYQVIPVIHKHQWT